MKHLFSSKINFLALLFGIMVFGCSRHTVTRLNPSQQIDLSGRWNDSDDQMVAESMIGDVLNRPWVARFQAAHKRRPVVIVGFVKNKTDQHIESDVFVTSLEEEFIRSGSVRVVQNSEFREKLRQERAQQQDYSSKETAKKFGKELGADFMLFGKINSVKDEYGKKKVIAYTVSLELDDIETNEKVWLNKKTIKKFIEN
ncbi:MAG: penicillin-binding protein activator LpoB [Cytophagales bacterium]|nr:penicillin-binding protein activator LpoB [Cytophagales bacterium]